MNKPLIIATACLFTFASSIQAERVLLRTGSPICGEVKRQGSPGNRNGQGVWIYAPGKKGIWKNFSEIETIDNGSCAGNGSSNYSYKNGRSSQPSRYGKSQTKRYGSSQPSRYGKPQTKRYGSSQPSRYGKPQTKRYGSSQRGRYGKSQTKRYGSSQRGRYGKPQTKRYGSSQRGRYGKPQTKRYGSSQSSRYGQQQPQTKRYSSSQSSRYGQQQPQTKRYSSSQSSRYGQQQPQTKRYSSSQNSRYGQGRKTVQARGKGMSKDYPDTIIGKKGKSYCGKIIQNNRFGVLLRMPKIKKNKYKNDFKFIKRRKVMEVRKGQSCF